LSQAGSRLVADGLLDEGGSLTDFKTAAKKAGSYSLLTQRILDNGNLILSITGDKKAGIFLLGNLIGNKPEFQVNVGPTEDGTVQVLSLALFTRPVFWDTFEFNVYGGPNS